MGFGRDLQGNYIGLVESTQPAVILVMVILVKMILSCQNPPLYINLIFIYSEQMTQSENENDHFDLDHFDHFFIVCVDDSVKHGLIYSASFCASCKENS